MSGIVLAGSIALGALVPGLAAAEIAPAPNQAAAPTSVDKTTGVADIIVTAQKRSESINKVGMAITAISGADLQTQQIKTISDLANIVPGLVFTTSAFNTPVISLRGVGFYDTSLGSYPTVSVYVDQVPLPFSAMAGQASLDVERVEALKGPQGILFGQNSTGGAINYIAAKPTHTLQAGADLGFGRFNTVQGDAFVSGPLTSTLTARIAVSGTHGGDWQYNDTRHGSAGKARRSAGRLLLDWKPTDRLSVELNINGWLDDSDPEAAQLIGRDPQHRNAAFVDAAFLTVPLARANPRAADWSPGELHSKQRQYQTSLRADYDLSDHATLTSLTSYVHYTRDAAVDGDGFSGHDEDTSSIIGKATSLSQELRLASKSRNRFRWVLGGNYERDLANEADLSVYSGSQVPGLFGFGAGAFFANQRMKNYAGFGNGEFDLLPRLTLKAGARYTEANRANFACGVQDTGDGKLAAGFSAISAALTGMPVVPPLGPGSCAVLDQHTFLPGFYRASLNQHNISWRGGLDYRATDTTLLYLNVAKGYKAGSFAVQGGSTTRALQPVVQESVLDYEGGFKTRLFDHRIGLTGTVFYYQYDDKQLIAKIVDPFFGVLPALVNIPKSSVKGAELGIDWAAAQRLRFSVSGDYLDAKVDRYTGVNQLGVLAKFDGTAMPFTPKWQIVHMGDYRWPMGDWNGFAGYTVNYRSATNSSVGGGAATKIDGYALFDLRGGFESPNGTYKITLWAKNIANKYYWTNVVRDNDAIVRYAGMPATYGASVAVKW